MSLKNGTYKTAYEASKEMDAPISTLYQCVSSGMSV